jgi:hypothetical protein
MHGAEPEWEDGRLHKVQFLVQRSQWKDWQSVVTNPYFPITKKYLQNLMNRCIRGPYVQWCERRSPSALLVGPSTRLAAVTSTFLIQHT